MNRQKYIEQCKNVARCYLYSTLSCNLRRAVTVFIMELNKYPNTKPQIITDYMWSMFDSADRGDFDSVYHFI